MKRAVKFKLVAPLVGVALIFATSAGTMAEIAVATICSGKIKKIAPCTTARPCDIAKNPQCNEAIVLADLLAEDCTGKGAVAADNCVDTTTERVCANKFACQKNVAGTACVQGAPGNQVKDYVPNGDGGTCFVESPL